MRTQSNQQLVTRHFMKNNILFSEKQRFNQWWLRVLLLGANGLLAYGVITQVGLGKQFGDKPSGDAGLILVLALIIVITVFMFSLRLETVIKTDGVYVKFFPFHLSFRRYSWDQIHKSYVRKYNPILEYGGWGLRGLGKNRALNVSGNQGLQLEMEGNKRLLIGTRKPEEVNEIIHKRRVN